MSALGIGVLMYKDSILIVSIVGKQEKISK